MSFFTTIGCRIIGWDEKILATCGEASKRQFRKLLSAVSIMMVLWGTIGFCFADRYLNMTNIYGKLGAAVVFMFIILCIERVIILNVGNNRRMAVARCFLAVCMAVLGACIFDQLMFKNDLQQEISQHREEVVAQTVKQRLAIYDADIARITKAVDSISACNDVLYRQIEAHPATTVSAVSTSEQVAGVGADGKPIKTQVRSVNKIVVPNPRIAQAQGNEEQLKIYNEQLDKLRLEKKNVHETVIKEVKNRPVGFIEELEATIRVISHSWFSLAFYIVMFCFLISLELFVLTIKMGETPCDYELIVEHQLSHKRTLLNATETSLAS